MRLRKVRSPASARLVEVKGEVGIS